MNLLKGISQPGVSWHPPFPPLFLPSLSCPSYTSRLLLNTMIFGCSRCTLGVEPGEMHIPHLSRDEHCASGPVGDPLVVSPFFPKTPEVSRFHAGSSWWIVTTVMKLKDLMPSDPLVLFKSHSAHQHGVLRLARHLRISCTYALPSVESFLARTLTINSSPVPAFYLIFHPSR